MVAATLLRGLWLSMYVAVEYGERVVGVYVGLAVQGG